jgi:hypothetical protein
LRTNLKVLLTTTCGNATQEMIFIVTILFFWGVCFTDFLKEKKTWKNGHADLV